MRRSASSIRRLALAALFLAAASLLPAQETLHQPPAPPALREALLAVISGHPRLAAARAERARAEAAVRAAGKAVYNPELELDTERAASDTSSVQLSQALDLGDQRGARTRVAEAELRQALARLERERQALARLAVIVPLTIFFIFVLLYTAFNSVRYATLIIANVPFATIGGLISLWLTGQYLSVPSAIGFIAVFGVAMLNGIVLVSFINELREQSLSVAEAVRRGAELRLRPVMMTASVAILGLMPMLLSTGVGAETQRPLATVVVGGLITSTLLTLILLPVVYEWMETRQEKHP